MSRSCLNFSQIGDRQPIQPEDRNVRTLPIQKISNIFG